MNEWMSNKMSQYICRCPSLKQSPCWKRWMPSLHPLLVQINLGMKCNSCQYWSNKDGMWLSMKTGPSGVEVIISTTTKTTKTTTQHVGWCGWEDTNVKTRTGTSAGVGAAAGADWVYWETVLVEVMEGKQRYTTQQSHNTTTAAMLQWWPAAARLGWSDAITQNNKMGGCGGADGSEGWRGSGEMKDRKWKSSASKI